MPSELQNLKDNMARQFQGMTKAEAHAKALCVTCAEPATTFTDPLSRKEYGISGLCQKCQDKIFGGFEE